MATKTATRPANGNTDMRAEAARFQEMAGTATEDVFTMAKDYVKANPENAALWCLGIGFVLGWKLKPW